MARNRSRSGLVQRTFGLGDTVGNARGNYRPAPEVSPGDAVELPREYRRVPGPLHRKPDRYDKMWTARVQNGQIEPPKSWRDKWEPKPKTN
jgi:hypothetical protein